MTSTFNVVVRLTGAQTQLVLDLLDQATDDEDNPTTVDGARRKIATAYERSRDANRRNRLGLEEPA